jgi:hypothetical protein
VNANHEKFAIPGFSIGNLRVGEHREKIEIVTLKPISSRAEHVVVGIHEKGEILPILPVGEKVEHDTRMAIRERILRELSKNHPDKKFIFPRK